jgi:hypothetical protein
MPLRLPAEYIRTSRGILLLLAAFLAAGADASSPPGWREAPEFLRLFAPARTRPGAYHIYVNAAPIEQLIQRIREDAGSANAPGAWELQTALPFDAFGQSGGYDRWKVARLYGSRRARVARGPRLENGRVVEAWTLVSPYPDAAQQRLEPGTLLIVLRVR